MERLLGKIGRVDRDSENVCIFYSFVDFVDCFMFPQTSLK